MSNIERWEGEADAIEAWNYVIGRLHMLVNKPGEGMSADELLDEADRQLRGAVEERDRLRALLKAGAGARRLWLVWRPDGALTDHRAVVVWNESDLREYRERGWGIEGPFADLVRLR